MSKQRKKVNISTVRGHKAPSQGMKIAVKILLTVSVLMAIACDVISIAIFNKYPIISGINIVFSTIILGTVGVLYKNKISKFSKLVLFNKIMVIIVLILTCSNTFAAYYVTDDVVDVLKNRPEKPLYDLAEITDEESDVFFLKEDTQVELAEHLKQSILFIEDLPNHGDKYLDTLEDYADYAPYADSSERMMLSIMKGTYGGYVDETVRYWVMESIYDNRGKMDSTCITVENRNSYFEDALSSATHKFRAEYKDDYLTAARYAWGKVYASVGLKSFGQDDLDDVIRVYKTMLDSHEFDEYYDNLTLIVSALELIKADNDFMSQFH